MFFLVAVNDTTRPYFCITLIVGDFKTFFDNVALQKLAVALAEFLKDVGKMEKKVVFLFLIFWRHCRFSHDKQKTPKTVLRAIYVKSRLNKKH